METTVNDEDAFTLPLGSSTFSSVNGRDSLGDSSFERREGGRQAEPFSFRDNEGLSSTDWQKVEDLLVPTAPDERLVAPPPYPSAARAAATAYTAAAAAAAVAEDLATTLPELLCAHAAARAAVEAAQAAYSSSSGLTAAALTVRSLRDLLAAAEQAHSTAHAAAAPARECASALILNSEDERLGSFSQRAALLREQRGALISARPSRAAAQAAAAAARAVGERLPGASKAIKEQQRLQLPVPPKHQRMRVAAKAKQFAAAQSQLSLSAMARLASSCPGASTSLCEAQLAEKLALEVLQAALGEERALLRCLRAVADAEHHAEELEEVAAALAREAWPAQAQAQQPLAQPQPSPPVVQAQQQNAVPSAQLPLAQQPLVQPQAPPPLAPGPEAPEAKAQCKGGVIVRTAPCSHSILCSPPPPPTPPTQKLLGAAI